MRVFLVAGKSGVGKNEVAKLIKEYYLKKEEATVITSFSKYLKLFAYEMTDWNGKEEEKPRKFLQTLGSVIRDDMHWPYFLIDRMFKDLEIYDRYFDNVVICDVRLVEEIEMFKKEVSSCYTIYVKGPLNNKLTEEEQNHITEIELDNYDKFDYTIDNFKKEDLHFKVLEMLEELS